MEDDTLTIIHCDNNSFTVTKIKYGQGKKLYCIFVQYNFCEVTYVRHY